MNCSDCDFAARIKEAEHCGIRYEDTPCATCELTEDSSHTLAFDEARDVPVTGGQAGVAGVAGVAGNGEQMEDPELPLSVLAEALRCFLELPHRAFRILQRRYNGDSYAVIAKELEVTPQAVEIQLRRTLEAHPHLKQMLPEKARRQAARKRKRLNRERRRKMGSTGEVR